MKRMIGTSENSVNFEVFGCDVLTSNEMYQVRGGDEVRPKTSEKDIFDEDNI